MTHTTFDLPQPQPPTEAETRIASRANRAETRHVRRQRDALAAWLATQEQSAGFTRTDVAAYPQPTTPIQAVSWLKTYADLLQGAVRQRAVVEALEVSTRDGCQHVCSIHPNKALADLDDARGELAHLTNALARYGASPTTPQNKETR